MDLQGSLSEFSVPDIIQFLGSAEKTGLLRVSTQPPGEVEMGTVFFDKGVVVHAELRALRGEEVLYAMMLWEEGRFVFDPDVTTDDSTVRQNNANMLMEGARRKDEWELMANDIPHLDLIPEFALPEDQDAGKQITLNTSEWVVLSKIDGARTLREVADAAGLSDFHTCRLLFSLIQNKLLRLRDQS